jgi:hypothetical protein
MFFNYDIYKLCYFINIFKIYVKNKKITLFPLTIHTKGKKKSIKDLGFNLKNKL